MEDKLEKLKKKNDLSDIILEKDNPSSGDKLKKILLGAASLVLLALIILIGMKMFNSSNVSQSESLANIGDNIEQTGENLVDGAVDAMDGAKDAVDEATDSSLFKKEAIIDENSENSETDQKFEEMVRKLKQQDALETPNKEATDVDDTLEKITDKPKEVIASARDSVVNKIKEITPQPIKKVKEIVKPISPKVIATSKPIQESIRPIREVKQEEIIQVPIIKSQPIKRREIITPSKPKRTYKAPSSSISSISGYFIQVGATSKSFPDKRFLQKIKNSGYDYIVHKVNVKGRNITKVLVGPYNSRNQARNELSGVQSTLNPSAYIYRVK